MGTLWHYALSYYVVVMDEQNLYAVVKITAPVKEGKNVTVFFKDLIPKPAKKKMATYGLAKLAPALKGYTFSTYDTAAKVTTKGKAKLAAPKKYSFITITAQKGSSYVTINF